ncbi:protein trichome birefringence [Trifolium repens]|nr:protein trichome birefringence [Trifolium repens]
MLFSWKELQWLRMKITRFINQVLVLTLTRLMIAKSIEEMMLIIPNGGGNLMAKATGAVGKTSELSSSGMEIEIAELLYSLMTSKKEKIQKKIKNNKEKEQEVVMSLIMLSRDVRPWCDINSIAEFSDNNNHDDNDDNSLKLDSPLTHLVSKIEVKKRVISNGSEFVKSERNDGLNMKRTLEGKDDDKKKEKMEIEVDSDSTFEVNVVDAGDIEVVKNSISSSSVDQKEKATQHGTKSEVKTKKNNTARINPAAKLLIMEYGLDASTLNATGPHGTLLKGDVLSAIKSGKLSPKPDSSKAKASSSSQSHQVAASQESKSNLKQSNVYEDFPNSQIRKCLQHIVMITLGHCRVISKRLLESKQNTPHLNLSSEQYDVKVSVNDIIIKVVAAALRNVPEANGK